VERILAFRFAVDFPLFRLYLRRAMHPGLGLVLLVVAVILFRRTTLPEAVLLDAENPAQLARGMVRRDVWFALSAVLLPALLAGAARWAHRWRAREASWLATRRPSRSRIVVTCWAAMLCGGALWLVAIAALGELAAGGSDPSFRPRRSWPLESAGWRDGESLLCWEAELPGLPAGSRARLHVGLIGDHGAVEELVFTARREGGAGATRTGTTRPGRRAHVEVELPEGDGLLTFELLARGADQPLLLEGAWMEVQVPAPERAGPWALALRLTLTLAAALALAMGLGAWVSAPTAVLLVGLCWAGVWLQGAFASIWPGADLPRAFSAVAEGRVPPELAPGSLAGAAALIGIGLLLLGAGLGGRGSRR